MREFLFFLSLFFIPTALMAQNFPYGKASQEEIDMKRYDKDTSAHAVILNEYGRSEIGISNSDDIRLTFEYHVKIKILDHRAFPEGTVHLYLRNNENNSLNDVIDNITAVTTYKDDNGLTQTIELDPKNIYKTRDNKYQTSMKFAMPGLREGCVIEYRYILITPFYERFRSWQFQGYIPKIHTEYEAHIPGFWTYNVALRGPLKLLKQQSEIERGCFSSHGATCDCLKLDYDMKDVPAFVNEEFMTSPKNFISALNFDLVERTNPYTGEKLKITKEWKDVDRILKESTEFGGQLKKKDAAKEHIPAAILNITDTTEKAKAIYRWVQAWFKWNNFIGIYSNDGIKKAIDAHTGSIADINLTLIAALNSVGINSEAVILSTREHGILDKLYPVISDFDYVIARVTIKNRSWFLDATDRMLPFGMLPIKCLNDQGRAFSMDKPSYWVDLDTKQRKMSTVVLDLTLQEDGKLKGTFTHYSQGYDAYLKRKEIKRYNSTDEYLDYLTGRLTGIKLLKSNITNVDSLDAPMNEEYDVEMDFKKNIIHNELIFNPYILDRTFVNPFRLSEHTYPVDMGMPSDNRYILTVHFPAQYIIESRPKNEALSLSDKDGIYLTNFDVDNNTLTFSSSIQFNKAIYLPAEYPYLKEFFNKIILTERQDIILKKTITN